MLPDVGFNPWNEHGITAVNPWYRHLIAALVTVNSPFAFDYDLPLGWMSSIGQSHFRLITP